MDFTLRDFVNSLKENMYNNFPYFEDEEIDRRKHPNRKPLHVRDIVFNEPIYISDNLVMFDIGNEKAERTYPYYHILEDSPIIRKRNRADEHTKGSQAKVRAKGKRDYSVISFNGKSFTKEYAKNVRGKRKQVIDNSTYFTNENGKRVKHNEDSNSYVNKHYHYLEKIADNINPILADMFGIQYVGSRGTNLKDEYIAQEYGVIMNYEDTLAFDIE